ncbi:uncharacterized protein MAM_07952 [Metarhizium album ARSEF 1941]|uniref:Uncharacterized protein n=1 Tax=Metarhizium album (strain ARSEF 1941) TaxID=1081103 RepID=A0A0B2WMH6_METAS|nr:uncharacterized protein MAM_07952 [Metarhizium album ARSEF 1941]KHN94215.1 hypothetical protein MAM_07952 [Metarhizium album ARSEF 1941]
MLAAVRALVRPRRQIALVSRLERAPPQSSRWLTKSAAEDSQAPKLKYPDPPTTNHSDLGTFRAYARRTGLDEKSTVYVGTHYEYKVSGALSRYGFFLKRIGGSSDHGTDLVGTWTLPSSSSSSSRTAPFKVLVQCKAGTQRVGPQHIRELEGAFVGAPVGWRGTGVLGLLACERAATRGVRDSLGRSKWPMVYICCSKEGVVSQMIWNQCVEELGLDGYGVSVRRGDDRDELVMMHNGAVVPFFVRGQVNMAGVEM